MTTTNYQPENHAPITPVLGHQPDGTHKTGTPTNNPSNWDTMFAPKIHTFRCKVCAKGWSPRGRVPGWNRCPHCTTIYSEKDLLGL